MLNSRDVKAPTSLTVRRSAPEVLDMPVSQAGEDTGAQRLQLVHALMRGRYGWAIAFALLLGIPAGVAGYLAGKPIYRSVRLIHVVDVIPKVLYSDEEKGLLPRYEGFVETQVSLIQSQRVADMAMQDDKWKASLQGRPAPGILDFSNAITVERKNELIRVSFDDPDPNTAMSGAQAVVDAYKKLFIEGDAVSDNRRLDILQQLQTSQDHELAMQKDFLASAAGTFGSNELPRLRDAKFEELEKLSATLADLELQQSLEDATKDAPLNVESMSVDQWAMMDQTLSGLIQQQRDADHRLFLMTADRLGPEHPSVKSVRSESAQLRREITERVQLLKLHPPEVSARRNDPSAPYIPPEALKARMVRVSQMVDKARTEYQQFSSMALKAQEYQAKIDDITKKRENTRERIDQLNVESSLSGRILPMGDAERPEAPFKDTRKKFAIFGGFGGAMLGFGSVLMLALTNRKIRSAEELQVRMSIDKLLGVLPHLPNDLSDPAQAARAAHAVHAMKTLLQIRAGADRPAIAITSPVSGSGKTSLVLALGVSFASTGAKVLLMDCDLVGGGLTRRVNAIARRKAGNLLVRAGLIARPQLREALSQSKKNGQKLGDTVVELGYAQRDAVEACLAEQHDASIGVLEAMAGEPISRCVAQTGVPNLSILPLGKASSQQAAALSPAATQRLFTAAKQQFDVVLVDTGPIPGSLEASVVAAAADGTVMVLSRGEPRRVAVLCLQQLHAVGAHFAGMVLNRVNASDVPLYSVSTSQVRESSRRDETTRQEILARLDEAADFGPMARAVVASPPLGVSK